MREMAYKGGITGELDQVALRGNLGYPAWAPGETLTRQGPCGCGEAVGLRRGEKAWVEGEDND